MLSYQHAFHAGNLADVQKHALLAWVLDYLTRKDKPLTYIETHGPGALPADRRRGKRPARRRRAFWRIPTGSRPTIPMPSGWPRPAR